MKRLLWTFAILAFAAPAVAVPTADPLQAEIVTTDIDLFFGIFDAAGGKPDARALQPYIDGGSPGVQGFIENRIDSAENLARVIASEPAAYAAARTCAENLGPLKDRVRAGFLALAFLYPEARYPTVYLVIGANNSGGTANAEALMIGLEVMCTPPVPSDLPLDIRLSQIILHELMHAVQAGFKDETVLGFSLNEGVAEFLTELTTGTISNVHLLAWTKGREAEIERRFKAQMNSTDFSPWLYGGPGTPQAPGDLGYWVGYRIAKAFYDRTADKRAAVKAMLEATDAVAFLKASGWQPAEPAAPKP